MENKCGECRRTFSNASNLKHHIRKFHNLKIDKLLPPKNYKFTCDNCGRHFNHVKHLRFHMKKLHGVTSEAKKNIQCPMSCTYKTSAQKECLEHFVQKHQINLEYEDLEFPTVEAFLEWKHSMEKITKSNYIKKRSFTTKCYTTLNYVCHRSGSYMSRSKGQRQLKIKGTNKIGGFCPAALTVVVGENGKHSVKFLRTHVGHQLDVGHLFLSDDDRQSIANKIASKIPFTSILDEMRDSVGNSELERIHLLTRKDLYNIEKSFNLNSTSVLHQNDVSVEAWAKEMHDAGSVLFHKAQGKHNKEHSYLKHEDFVLIIMNNTQAELLLKYGSDCICIDSTLGMNYGFELNTLLVLGDSRQHFPCAFLVSNRNDQGIFGLFFSCIKEKVGLLSPKVFMSDLTDLFYNVWVEIMCAPQYRLFSTWHLDRAWRSHLDKIPTKEKQAEIYKQMRTLLEETDRGTFSVMLDQFIAHLNSDPDMKLFAKYFSEHYAPKAALWAYCYRAHLGINTNMQEERIHNTLKYIYLEAKHVNRFDKAIHAIMQFVRDKLFEISAVQKPDNSGTLLDDRKNKILAQLSEMLDKVTSVEECIVFERAIASIPSALAAAASLNCTHQTVNQYRNKIQNIPHKKLCKQRLYTTRKCIKVKTTQKSSCIS